MACMPGQPADKAKAKPYFDIEGLINEQAILLDSISPSFVKTVSVDGKEEAVRNNAPHGGWSEELHQLRQLDLNMANLLGKYNVQEITSDSIVKLYFTSLTSESTKIDTLIVTLHQVSKKPLKIHGFAHTANLLFENATVVDVSFSTVNQKTFIASYDLATSQKLVTQAASSFTMKVDILLP